MKFFLGVYKVLQKTRRRIVKLDFHGKSQEGNYRYKQMQT